VDTRTLIPAAGLVTASDPEAFPAYRPVGMDGKERS
jgi:hypothetical protein